MAKFEIGGLPVIDAKRPLKLTVTKGDISRADIKEPSNCVVARACRRELHVIEARVHLNRVYLRSNKRNWVRYVTPSSMRSEIIAFDRGGKFEPAEFHLSAPQPAKRLGKRFGGTKPYVRGSYKRRVAGHITANVRAGPA